MKTTKETIQSAVVDILCSKLEVSIELCDSNFWDLPLTGDHFRLSAVDLAYLFFEIERMYNLRIKEEYLFSYGFNSINKISEIILECESEIS